MGMVRISTIQLLIYEGMMGRDVAGRRPKMDGNATAKSEI